MTAEQPDESGASVPEVRIDGVLYVPVSKAHIDAEAIRDAIVTPYMGSGWRESYPHSPGYLRVIVTDNPEDANDGLSVDEFIAQILAALTAPEAGS